MIKIKIDFFRKNICDYAYTFMNKKYIFNSEGPDEFDAPGFTWYIFKVLFNLDINQDGYGMDNTTKQLTNNLGILHSYIEDDSNKSKYLLDIPKGSLVFFHTQAISDNQPLATNKYPGHVGIYLGDNQFIHASFKEKRIVIDSLDDYWLKKLVASRDIIANLKELKIK